MSTREELLADPLAKEKLDLPNGKTIWLRELTAGEMEAWRNSGRSDAIFFAYGAMSEDGRRLFDPNDPADIALINRMGSGIVKTCVVVLLRLSGYGDATAKN